VVKFRKNLFTQEGKYYELRSINYYIWNKAELPWQRKESVIVPVPDVLHSSDTGERYVNNRQYSSLRYQKAYDSVRREIFTVFSLTLE
jgi:hypothetical protein